MLETAALASLTGCLLEFDPASLPTNARETGVRFDVVDEAVDAANYHRNDARADERADERRDGPTPSDAINPAWFDTVSETSDASASPDSTGTLDAGDLVDASDASDAVAVEVAPDVFEEPSCSAGQTLCGEFGCVPLATSLEHCGACANRCPVGDNSLPACVRGVCSLTCLPGFADCDRDPATGCERDLRTDPDNCGRCGVLCARTTNAVATCSVGTAGQSTCGIVCNDGYADCDGVAENGCEVALTADAANCSACGRACPREHIPVPVCASSTCGGACEAGWGECDREAANGCEAHLEDDARNCGGCGNACPVRNRARPTCTSGACGISCDAGFGNCDGTLMNGCEIDLASNRAHCGACGNACPSALPGATGVNCVVGGCQPVCEARRGNCDGVAGNGCETETTTINACGSCSRACSAGSGAFRVACCGRRPDGALGCGRTNADNPTRCCFSVMGNACAMWGSL